MSDSQSLTLPRIGSRSKRRKLPRPPKFTWAQKFLLAWNGTWLVFNVITFIADAHLSNLLASAVFALFIHATVLDAMRPPLGGLQSFITGMALAVAWLPMAIMNL